MAFEAGVDMTLEIQTDDSPLTFTEIDCVSELGMQVSHEVVDVTTKGSNQARTLSTATGLIQYSSDVSFVTDLTKIAALTAAGFALEAGVTARVKVGTATYTGRWLVENLSYKSAASGVVTGTCSLQSAGEITVA